MRVEFDVELGGAGLLGDAVFSLGPGEAGVFDVLYAPLVAGVSVGAVSFANDRLGQFWCVPCRPLATHARQTPTSHACLSVSFLLTSPSTPTTHRYKLNLTATPAPPKKLPAMRAAVGDVEEQEVTVENPSGVPLELRAAVSNRRNFSVRPSTLELPPYGQGAFILRYTPATIDKAEDVVVTLSAPSVGEWVYMATGTGMIPGTMPQVSPMAVVHERASHTLVFRNPFDSALSVSTELAYNDSAGAARPFDLLMRRSRTRLPPFGAMQIPYVFSPSEMTEYAGASIVVRSENFEGSEHPLAWRYPLLGIAEAPPHARRIEIVTKAREPMTRTIVLPLAGLKPNDAGVSETFTFELLTDSLESSESGTLLNRSLSLEGVGMTVDAVSAESGNASVKVRAQFQPLRPFSLAVELVVRKASGGGQWRFTLWIEAKQPDIDDTISLEGMLHQTSSVAFTLNNPFPESAPFKAFLTADSPSELVRPVSACAPLATPPHSRRFMCSRFPNTPTHTRHRQPHRQSSHTRAFSSPRMAKTRNS